MHRLGIILPFSNQLALGKKDKIFWRIDMSTLAICVMQYQWSRWKAYFPLPSQMNPNRMGRGDPLSVHLRCSIQRRNTLINLRSKNSKKNRDKKARFTNTSLQY